VLKGQILAVLGFSGLGSRHSTTELRPQTQRINIISVCDGACQREVDCILLIA
jgi:hypothetical protein